MQKPIQGGGTVRDGLLTYKRMTGKDHPEAVAPTKPPISIMYLYRWFMDMARGRPISGGVLLTIPPSEIFAWTQLKRIILSDWELACIQDLDATYLRIMSEK